MARGLDGSCPPPPADETRRRALRLGALAAAASLLVAGAFALVYYARNADRPERHADVLDHFKYGSIGSDRPPLGLPLEVLVALPELFPRHLPPGAPRDLTAFGFVKEEGHDLPIGFSRRRALFIDLDGDQLRRVPHDHRARAPGRAAPDLPRRAGRHGRPPRVLPVPLPLRRR